jgi:hypothetical protein
LAIFDLQFNPVKNIPPLTLQPTHRKFHLNRYIPYILLPTLNSRPSANDAVSIAGYVFSAFIELIAGKIAH